MNNAMTMTLQNHETTTQSVCLCSSCHIDIQNEGNMPMFATNMFHLLSNLEQPQNGCSLTQAKNNKSPKHSMYGARSLSIKLGTLEG